MTEGVSVVWSANSADLFHVEADLIGCSSVGHNRKGGDEGERRIRENVVGNHLDRLSEVQAVRRQGKTEKPLRS